VLKGMGMAALSAAGVAQMPQTFTQFAAPSSAGADGHNGNAQVVSIGERMIDLDALQDLV
jgi:hypothetical protein